MAIRYDDECISCDICIGNSCPNRNVKRYYCDACRDEVDTLYDVNGIQLCEECTLKQFKVVE